ncbi:MAG TPA: hypothetical protein VGJ86_13230 [Acidimicrobiales bacterium]|jgi:hypothetical protein
MAEVLFAALPYAVAAMLAAPIVVVVSAVIAVGVDIGSVLVANGLVTLVG